MTEYQDARSRWWLAYLAFVIMALFAGSSEAQLKDCFDVYKEARQSRRTALYFCCTGTFDKNKRNSMGWLWHKELNLYVDETKCDPAELRKILIEKLKR